MCIKSVCVVCKVLTGAGCWTGKKNFKGKINLAQL